MSRWWMFAEFLEPEHDMTLGGVRHCRVRLKEGINPGVFCSID